MVQQIVDFPRPVPEYDAEEFWAGCRRHELLMQRCGNCGKYRWLPRPMCPHCNSLQREWVKVSGRGKVFTWTIVTHPVHPAAASKVPYNVVEVELEEQPDLRIVSNLVDCQNEDISFGMPVEVVFEDKGEGENAYTLPKFRPLK